MLHDLTTTRPDWMDRCNAQDDAFQDAWAEATDPENERGEIVTAYYEVSSQPVDEIDPDAGHNADWRDLRGISVEGDKLTLWFSRDDLVRAGFSPHRFDGWA